MFGRARLCWLRRERERGGGGRHGAEDVVEGEGGVAGVRAEGPDGAIDIRADLTVGCDGRHSIVRARSGLAVEDLGAPMDALWFWLPKHSDDPIKTTSSLEAGRSIVLMDRGDYWQCALMILKGSADETRRAGLPALRAEVAKLELRDLRTVVLREVLESVDSLIGAERTGGCSFSTVRKSSKKFLLNVSSFA